MDLLLLWIIYIALFGGVSYFVSHRSALLSKELTQFFSFSFRLT